MKLLLIFFTLIFSFYSQNKKHISRHIYSIYQKSSIENAIRVYHSLKNNDSYNYNVDELNDMGYHLLKQKKIKDALIVFKLNTTEYPNEPNVFDSYAEGLLINKDYTISEKMYKKAVELSGHSPDYVINLIKFYERTGESDQALKQRFKFTKLYNKPELYDEMINAYFKYDKPKKAIDLFHTVSKKYPDYLFPVSRNQLLLNEQNVKNLNDGWKIKITKKLNKKLYPFEQKVALDKYKNVNGIVIIKNNTLIYENYFHDSHMFSLHDVRSVGKTFASAALGISIDDGHIQSENEKLSTFYNLKGYQQYHPKKNDIQLKHLLTMTSGFEGFDFDQSSIGNEENMYPQSNWVKWALSLPMSESRAPGDKWYYFTAGIVLLGDIIHKSVPGGLENYLGKKLFNPLQITRYKWQYTPQKVANTAGGIRLTARGFAKFGQLYKNNGVWNNKQILSEQWVKKSLVNHTSTTIDGNSYGYLFWKKTYRVNNVDFPVTYASGNGGNKIFIFDTKNIVVVITASAYGQQYAHSQVDDIMIKHIIPSVLIEN